MAIGTPAYMSPEQSAVSRDIDGRSDLITRCRRYQMACGDLPFTRRIPVDLVSICPRPVPVEHRRIDLPADLSRISCCSEKIRRTNSRLHFARVPERRCDSQRTLGSHMPTSSEEESQRRSFSSAGSLVSAHRGCLRPSMSSARVRRWFRSRS